MYVFHTAASSYSWDNVAFYDFTFRQLMAAKPWRSWSKTYMQGWNLAMKESVQSNQNQTQKHKQYGSESDSKGRKPRSWRDNCCWKYQKNKCQKTGSECDFDHRCTYCGGWNHGFFNCRKRLRKNGGHGQSGTAGQSSQNNAQQQHRSSNGGGK